MFVRMKKAKQFHQYIINHNEVSLPRRLCNEFGGTNVPIAGEKGKAPRMEFVWVFFLDMPLQIHLIQMWSSETSPWMILLVTSAITNFL